jgi:hypothetical protein
MLVCSIFFHFNGSETDISRVLTYIVTYPLHLRYLLFNTYLMLYN